MKKINVQMNFGGINRDDDMLTVKHHFICCSQNKFHRSYTSNSLVGWCSSNTCYP